MALMKSLTVNDSWMLELKTLCAVGEEIEGGQKIKNRFFNLIS